MTWRRQCVGGNSATRQPNRHDHRKSRHRQRWYHTNMDKTTIYLPTELKSAIKRVARQRGVSEAEVIRDSIRDAVGDDRPRPRGGLFASGAPIGREADEHLSGFGER
jgi:hypothetical protein